MRPIVTWLGMADIYLMDPDGKQIRQPHQNSLNTDTEPAWSPDGQKITFMSYPRCEKKHLNSGN